MNKLTQILLPGRLWNRSVYPISHINKLAELIAPKLKVHQNDGLVILVISPGIEPGLPG